MTSHDTSRWSALGKAVLWVWSKEKYTTGCTH